MHHLSCEIAKGPCECRGLREGCQTVSGQGESDPWLDLGKVAYYHYTMAARNEVIIA
jgi:hypothetical protein